MNRSLKALHSPERDKRGPRYRGARTAAPGPRPPDPARGELRGGRGGEGPALGRGEARPALPHRSDPAGRHPCPAAAV